MPESAAEFEYHELSPMKRYYNDLYYSKADYKSIVIALDKCLEQTIGDSLGYQCLAGDRLLPSESELESSPRIGIERLALFPIVVLGPIIEADTERSKEQIRDWYVDAVVNLRILTKPSHSAECLSLPTLMDVACDKSEQCPERLLERFFSDNASLSTKFNNAGYLIDPARQNLLVHARLEAGVKAKILLPEYSASCLVQYEDEYRQYFPDFAA